MYAVSPYPWLTDLLPKVSAGAYGAQLDVQLDYYNAYNDNNAYYDMYLEPKLTYDLGFMKLVPGLKPYVQARIALATTNPAYTVNGLEPRPSTTPTSSPVSITASPCPRSDPSPSTPAGASTRSTTSAASAEPR